MITNIVQYFYPDIRKEEFKKIGLLGLTFLFTIGSYWLLRLLKDVVLIELAFPKSLGFMPDEGINWLPSIKMISPFVVLGVVIIYTKLVDLFAKHKLFYIICSFYGSCFTIVGSILYSQAIYGSAFVGATILKYTGLCSYLLIESFGSVVVALFWSFTVSSTTTDQAKRSFPFIIALGQLGSIGGSSLMCLESITEWPLFFIATIFLVCNMLTIKYLITSVPANQMKSDKEEKKKKPDMLGGIKLLLTKPYLIGVLVVSTFYEIAGTINDYQMKVQATHLAREGSLLLFSKIISLKQFMGVFGTSVNIVAFAMALLGTSKLMKKYGIRICLLIYPISFAIALVSLYGYYFHQTSNLSLLWATFIVMLIVKASAYAVNNPVKEMMYIPTSKDAKFKTKGIIDMVGNRSAKATGSSINKMLSIKGNFGLTIQNLMVYGSLIGLGVIGVWLIAAIYVGNKNKKLVDNNQIIE